MIRERPILNIRLNIALIYHKSLRKYPWFKGSIQAKGVYYHGLEYCQIGNFFYSVHNEEIVNSHVCYK